MRLLLRSPRSWLYGRQVPFVALVGLLLALFTVLPRAQARQSPEGQPELDTTLRALAAYVDRYFSGAQSIVGTERVTIQPLSFDLTPEGRTRRLVYDIRVEWGPGDDGEPVGKVVRELVRADGRPPRPRDEPECLDPLPITPEPLAMLRSSAQGRFIFSLAGRGKVDGRPVRLVDYRGRRTDPVTAEFTQDCARMELGNRTAGRIWMDEDSGEVLRFEEHVSGLVTVPVPRSAPRTWQTRSLEIERGDTSIRYRRVTFTDPVETMLLPESIDVLTVIRSTGISRVRVRQQYSNYRRFVTGGRVVE